MEYEHLSHSFEPIYDKNSSIIILGSFPSVKSREQQFYYGHPQNRFWRVLSNILDCKIPNTVLQKKQLLLENHIAVWDVIAECDIIGSSDNSIKNVITNPVEEILHVCDIKRIFANGAKAAELYQKYSFKKTKRECITLPSTSPANAVFSIEKLCQRWEAIKEPLLYEKE